MELVHRFKDLTVVIPTYNRPKYLERSLEYWARSLIKVIVVDGSPYKYSGDIPCNVSYYHDSNVNIGRRWANGLHKVQTPFSVLCADDDFLSLSGIEACLDFLRSNSDYASAQGVGVRFQVDNKMNIFVEISNSLMVGHDINGSTALERLNQLFIDYIEQTYSICRTPILQMSLDTCIDQTNPHYIEHSTIFVPSVFGKHKVLPVLYSAREEIQGSARGSFELPRFEILKSCNKVTYELWRESIVKIYAEEVNVSLDSAFEVFDRNFTQYLDWDLRTNHNVMPLDTKIWSLPIIMIAKAMLKKFIPESLLWSKRRLYRRINSLRTGNVLNYPFTDPKAEAEWLKLADFIIENDAIYKLTS